MSEQPEDLEPGDLVIELIDGVPHVRTVGEDEPPA